MPTAIPAMKGRLGNTSYYVLTIKASELIEKTTIPREMENWDNLSLEEIYQRDINYTRVRKQIAPYLARNKDRFFGAIILAAKHMKDDPFEPLGGMLTSVPKLYREAAESIGFLNLSGEEVLIPLDGQHRLEAIKFAIRGVDQRGENIVNLSPCSQLAQEDVTVILIKYEEKKARRIFTVVNSYAKKTTAGQNLVTDDEDIIAVLSRDITNNLIGAELVNYTTNTLGKNDGYFTTLATLANCNKDILRANFPQGEIDRNQLPGKPTQQLYSKKLEEVWSFLIKNINVFSDLLHDKGEIGNKKRIEIRKTNLLGKPAPQWCLVASFAQLTSHPFNYSLKKAAEKLNAIPWEIKDKMWDRVLITGDRIITVKKNIELARNLIMYRCGADFTEEQRKNLLKRYQEMFPENERKGKKLPRVL